MPQSWFTLRLEATNRQLGVALSNVLMLRHHMSISRDRPPVGSYVSSAREGAGCSDAIYRFPATHPVDSLDLEATLSLRRRKNVSFSKRVSMQMCGDVWRTHHTTSVVYR
ncbi:hypothetical protein JR316_0001568 [Psilocybe cubensis]|uniref:Uncharacterized protein n=1 Tax=Psilocybe cubensis TaxID=181762 RepID=A0ACB8HBT6_PSICU|nr:hypothetical protein JR316_0001568 [Psilocybe cubensis]KAH9484669.1 hypothetical protein JR316_0001568 [Psilocybe cubensis]